MISEILSLKPGDFVLSNEENKKMMVIESIDPVTQCATCIWFNEETKSFERIYIFQEDLLPC